MVKSKEVVQQDKLYASKDNKVGDFTFDDSVADVFPDMISRSVPGYDDIIRGAARIAKACVKQNERVYDIGCSLGQTSLSISRALHQGSCNIIAIDNAPAMVDRCQRLVSQYALPNPINVICADAEQVIYDQCAMICMNFTLQFIAREKRQALLQTLHHALKPGGILLLSEKIRHPSARGNELLIDLHHAFKRDNGYSELEIAQKRAALENVMKTDTITEHTARLSAAGFCESVVWYQNYNFVSLIAEKAR